MLHLKPVPLRLLSPFVVLVHPPQLLSSEENYHSTYSSQSDSQYGSPPRGWSEELDEHGHTLYVSEYTQEKVQSFGFTFESLGDFTVYISRFFLSHHC